MYLFLWSKNGDVVSMNIAGQEETEFMSILQKNSYQLFYFLNFLKYWENCNMNRSLKDS